MSITTPAVKSTDEPRFVNNDGTKRWYKEGTTILHRLGGPAIEHASGRKEWWENGKRHRVGGPAIEGADGYQAWWVNGELHRLGGGPAVEDAGGDKQWWKFDRLHRLDGPAKESKLGMDQWWVNGHQIKGLALETFKQAISQTTPSSKVGELSHHENSAVAEAAANNPNCPLEDKVEWTLTRGEALG